MKKILAHTGKLVQSGFTLVELLIVIGILGAIALIVIAAINPIEQANRSRDARYQADGGQLLGAIERYFATQNKFPWQGCTATGCTTSADAAFGFATAGTEAVGLCGSSCAVSGTLVTNDELKNSFLGRDWVTGATVDKQIQIGKGAGGSSSVYACYIPASKSVRDKAIAAGKVRTLSFTASGTVTTTTACATSSVDWVTNACYVCIPE